MTDTALQPYSSLALAEPLKRAVADMGYENMTPIQAQAIPVVLAGPSPLRARLKWHAARPQRASCSHFVFYSCSRLPVKRWRPKTSIKEAAQQAAFKRPRSRPHGNAAARACPGRQRCPPWGKTPKAAQGVTGTVY